MKYRSITIRIFCTVILFMSSVFLLCSCRGPVELGINDKGSSIEIKKGDEIIILLESNPTTGYSWILGEEIDTNIVSLTGSKFMQKEKELVGTGGCEVFTFKAKSSGHTEIILYYQRPWEEVELKDEFIFNIDVTVK